MHKKVTLKPTKEKSILRRHPWVFSGAIKNIEQGIINGDIVEIINNKGRFLGYGHYNEGSIAVRLFEFNAVEINESYWKLKLERAIQHRLTSLNINNHNRSYRLVHGEGDEMPGCIIDVYNIVISYNFILLECGD